ncbi:MAG: putative IS66 family transposase [Streblomastix strix]|uniref:Putative IS66 family transposase n=1 Tax=Streblomastix strix TaxID=222440 RepID=A0A5J4VB92_9EUKA|nr:MAG: putative IS66 family transposase [Streblomastix strix]
MEILIYKHNKEIDDLNKKLEEKNFIIAKHARALYGKKKEIINHVANNVLERSDLDVSNSKEELKGKAKDSEINSQGINNPKINLNNLTKAYLATEEGQQEINQLIREQNIMEDSGSKKEDNDDQKNDNKSDLKESEENFDEKNQNNFIIDEKMQEEVYREVKKHKPHISFKQSTEYLNEKSTIIHYVSRDKFNSMCENQGVVDKKEKTHRFIKVEFIPEKFIVHVYVIEDNIDDSISDNKETEVVSESKDQKGGQKLQFSENSQENGEDKSKKSTSDKSNVSCIHEENSINNEFKDEFTTEYGNTMLPVDAFKFTMASPSFVSRLINLKFNYGVPLHRMEILFGYLGYPFTKQTLSNYVNRGAQLLKPLYDELAKTICENELAICQADESPLRVVNSKKKGYLWVYATCDYDSIRAAVFDFQMGRNSEYPMEFFKDFKGYLVCDGYSSYGKLENVTLVRCWVHARREYYEYAKGGNQDATIIIEKINKIFSQDRTIRENADFNPQVIKEQRLLIIEPMVDEYLSYIQKFKDEHPKSIIEKAINYSLNKKEDLKNFLKDGHLPMDNNKSERLVRDFALGRKNYLFSINENGGKTIGICLTFVELAKLNSINPEKYLLGLNFQELF